MRVSSPAHLPHVLVLAGVAGSGKTEVGREVARRLGWAFLDADDLHAPESIARMRAGRGLTDEERGPWLDAVRAAVDAALRDGRRLVVACSALRRVYRERVGGHDPRVRFVALEVPPAELHARLVARTGHFAGAALLASQLEAWEPLEPDEGLAVPATGSVRRTADAVLAALGTDQG